MRPSIPHLLALLLSCSGNAKIEGEDSAAKTKKNEVSKTATAETAKTAAESNAAPRHECPCCGHPTLPNRGMYDICQLCLWEDDPSYDSARPDAGVGGANGKYTLRAARANFDERMTMYDESDERSHESERTKKTKRELIAAYKALENAPRSEHPKLLEQITVHKETLLQEVIKSTN